MGRRLVGSSGNDCVYTPDPLSLSIVNNLNPKGVCFDPCAGKGSFIRAFKLHGNKYEWCEINKGRDFFQCDHTKASWLITNPPYSLISKFLVHSMSLDVPSISFLCTVNAFWMNGKLKRIKKYNYQIVTVDIVESPYFRKLNNWPQSGFTLGVTTIKKATKRLNPIANDLKVSWLKW